MDKQAKEFADNKLILLYILHKIGIPLTNLQISRIVWEFDFINYFDMQQCLYELLESAHVDYFKRPQACFYDITPQGEEAINLFKDRIRFSFREKIDNYAKNYKQELLKETQFVSGYEQKNDTSYIVDLKVIEADRIIFQLKLDLPVKSQAMRMCEGWKDNAEEIYAFSLKALMNGKKQVKDE